MHTHEIGPSIVDPGPETHHDDQPFLEIEGVEGSTLRATPTGIVVCPSRTGSPSRDDRRWRYDQLSSARLDAYGSVGVIRATVRSTGGSLPLLLLEPEQIPAARRALEIIWNLMSSADVARLAS